MKHYKIIAWDQNTNMDPKLNLTFTVPLQEVFPLRSIFSLLCSFLIFCAYLNNKSWRDRKPVFFGEYYQNNRNNSKTQYFQKSSLESVLDSEESGDKTLK